MTTSYESETTAFSGQPSLNAEGNQTWNPAVGIYNKAAAQDAHSYAGIVGALEDIQAANGYLTKAYPHNFAGIIAAIQDLKFSQLQPPVIPGPNPGNGNIVIDIDGNPIFQPSDPMPDGALWFDTRQGRLFVSINDEWYQTNGADGIPIVTNTSAVPQVEHPIPGQLWWDASNNDLYIFDGIFELPDGGFTDNPNAGGTPVWKLITDGLADAFQNTRTLPLGAVGPKIASGEIYEAGPDDDRPGLGFYFIRSPEPTEMSVQSDYNLWIYDAFKDIDKAVNEQSAVTIGINKPVDPKPGDLWYDTETLELSIYYIDDDTAQWVPTSTAYTFDDDLATLTASIQAEVRNREQAVNDLYTHIQSILGGNVPDIDALETKVAELEQHVNNHPKPDLTGYATDNELEAYVNQLQVAINNVSQSIPDITPLATKAEVSAVSSSVSLLPSKDYVDTAIAAAQPDLTYLVTQQHIDESIGAITTEYLPRTGGTLSGSFVVEKEDIAQPAFDFSQQKWYSYNTHKYRTNAAAELYSTFGTNTNPWEYAWNFSSNEDYCWVYGDNNKVFSITKDGPACSQLILGDFLDNDTTNGRQLRNKIDVKDRLETYQLALEEVRQGVANATDFDSLKSNILSALAIV